MEFSLSEKIIKDLMFLWATIDPIGTLALFAALTANFTAKRRRHTALKAILYSGAILLSSILVGQIFLTYMGIQLISLQLSGAIILFLFGIQMVFGNSSPDSTAKEPEHDIAVFPLAIPAIATPGGIMAVIILTDNQVFDIQTQFCTAGVLIGILTITYCFMLLATPIMKVIGKNGAAILVKLMGMVLAALSIEIIMNVLEIPEWVNSISN